VSCKAALAPSAAADHYLLVRDIGYVSAANNPGTLVFARSGSPQPHESISRCDVSGKQGTGTRAISDKTPPEGYHSSFRFADL